MSQRDEMTMMESGCEDGKSMLQITGKPLDAATNSKFQIDHPDHGVMVNIRRGADLLGVSLRGFRDVAGPAQFKLDGKLGFWAVRSLKLLPQLAPLSDRLQAPEGSEVIIMRGGGCYLRPDGYLSATDGTKEFGVSRESMKARLPSRRTPYISRGSSDAFINLYLREDICHLVEVLAAEELERMRVRVIAPPPSPRNRKRPCSVCGKPTIVIFFATQEYLCLPCRRQNKEFKCISKTTAKKVYRLTDRELLALPHEERVNPYYRSAPPMTLYRLVDVEAVTNAKLTADDDPELIAEYRSSVETKLAMRRHRWN